MLARRGCSSVSGPGEGSAQHCGRGAGAGARWAAARRRGTGCCRARGPSGLQCSPQEPGARSQEEAATSGVDERVEAAKPTARRELARAQGQRLRHDAGAGRRPLSPWSGSRSRRSRSRSHSHSVRRVLCVRLLRAARLPVCLRALHVCRSRCDAPQPLLLPARPAARLARSSARALQSVALWQHISIWLPELKQRLPHSHTPPPTLCLPKGPAASLADTLTTETAD
ncbi:hypothetical protein SVAN01_01862 [Stagonosporopsis vannaccii]|nr:hypothetical protein SVAN01_01862 [Stagonosporopsis vannaccii]